LGRLPLWYHGRMKLSPLYVSLAACLLLSAMGCSGLYAGHKFAVSTETAHQLPESKGVISQQRGIGVAVAAQNEVKDADVFYVVIMNESGEYVKYDKNALRLIDDTGKEHKPLNRHRVKQLTKRYKPRPPIGFSRDVFSQRQAHADIGDRVSPLNAADVFTSTVMPGSRGTFFVYFPTKSVSSPVLHLKVGGIELGGFGDELIFMYRFEVQE